MRDDRHVSLNINVRGLGESETLRINEICTDIREDGRKVYDLGLGQSPFPVPVPVVEALKLHAHEKKYLNVKGLKVLRQAVADFHKQKDQVNAQAENVLIGPGSKELMFLLQLVFYGEIILPTPCWVSYVPQAQIIGRKVGLIPTSFEDKWRISAEKCKELFEEEHDEFRPRLMVLNYPSNPDGGTYTADELQRIADVAREYEVILLADEIYGQLHHKGEHVSVARFYPEGTIISSGLSKWCGAGGWRLGTFTFPPNLNWLLKAMAAVASETYTSVCTPVQYAAVRAFNGGIAIERYLWHARRILANLGNRCAEILAETGIRVHKPDGAFYLFLDLSPFKEKLASKDIKTSAALSERLLKDVSVATVPGLAFERPEEELTFRIAYINFDGAKALAASETIALDQKLPEEFVLQHCSDALEAVKRIGDWVSDI
jgi:aspartate aminotransferase